MGNLSPHFSDYEFQCKCGCKSYIRNTELIDMLERLYSAMNAKEIIITSGTRCPNHSLSVGGTISDAHTKGIAVDIRVLKKNGQAYSAPTIAREAEKLGFTGIGIIDNYHCHVDIRNLNNYINSHWYGDERTHNDYIDTFANMGEQIYKDNTKHTLQTVIYLDGKKVIDKTEEITL